MPPRLSPVTPAMAAYLAASPPGRNVPTETLRAVVSQLIDGLERLDELSVLLSGTLEDWRHNRLPNSDSEVGRLLDRTPVVNRALSPLWSDPAIAPHAVDINDLTDDQLRAAAQICLKALNRSSLVIARLNTDVSDICRGVHVQDEADKEHPNSSPTTSPQSFKR